MRIYGTDDLQVMESNAGKRPLIVKAISGIPGGNYPDLRTAE